MSEDAIAARIAVVLPACMTTRPKPTSSSSTSVTSR